ncbi:MAG: YecA family protein [Leptothrix sp. (in: Bacteria)]|nr:YecA family protein [Leptothrix sp. (in: b-proteobacteria)]
MDYPRYDPASAVTPLTPAELDGLDQLLQALPADGVMSLDGVDGFLTALQVGPPALLAGMATAEWLPWVWGGDGPGGNEAPEPFASKRQRKATVVLLLRHLRHLGHQLDAALPDWEPVFSVAEKGADEFVDARDWCAGFLQAVDLQASAWDSAWGHAATAAAAAPLLALGGGIEGVECPPAPADEDLLAIDAASRAVPDAALALRAHFRPGAGGAA